MQDEISLDKRSLKVLEDFSFYVNELSKQMEIKNKLQQEEIDFRDKHFVDEKNKFRCRFCNFLVDSRKEEYKIIPQARSLIPVCMKCFGKAEEYVNKL